MVMIMSAKKTTTKDMAAIVKIFLSVFENIIFTLTSLAYLYILLHGLLYCKTKQGKYSLFCFFKTLVGPKGIGPLTSVLSGQRSTTELRAHKSFEPVQRSTTERLALYMWILTKNIQLVNCKIVYKK